MTYSIAISHLDRWVAKKIGQKCGRVTREQIACYQLARINETITRARSLSPFYQRHLAERRENQLVRLTDFSEYPFTTAVDIADYGMQMICGSQSQISRVVTLTTSGTTGKPKRLYFTSSDQELTIDFFRCGMSALAGAGNKALILLPGERPGSVGDLLRQALQRNEVDVIGYGLVFEVPDAVAVMCREKADCLVGVPVQVLAMARYWERWNDSSWMPKAVLLSTDHTPQVIVHELKRIWHCEVYDHYGMTEMGLGGGLECAAHSGYHLREADLYFEVIDPYSASPLPDGEYGEVVFTTLTRQGMPLIRYRTGDISRFIPEPCFCGSNLRRLERIKRRKDGMVEIWAGRAITIADLDEALFVLPDVINFTAELYDDKTCLKVVVFVLPDSCLDKSAVVQALHRLTVIREAEGDNKILLEIAIVRHWPLPSGKRLIRIGEDTGNERQEAGKKYLSGAARPDISGRN